MDKSHPILGKHIGTIHGVPIYTNDAMPDNLSVFLPAKPQLGDPTITRQDDITFIIDALVKAPFGIVRMK